MTTEPDLSIILPCYNEAGNIPFIIQSFQEVIGNEYYMEIILVNNGSIDHSSEVLEQEFAKVNDPRFRTVKVDKNIGYGFGILSGLAAAKGNVFAWTHADMQTPLSDVLVAYQAFKEQNDTMAFVKGRRMGRSLGPAFFTWGMQVISSIALKTDLEDIAAQPKVFSKEFYEKYLKKDAPNDFSLDLYAMYWAAKEGKIVEIPVVFGQRLHGEAKGGGNLKTRIKVTKRTFKYIFELKEKLGIK